jgi:hypothetical protein
MTYIGIIGSRTRNSDHDKKVLKKTLLEEIARLGNNFSKIRIVSGGCLTGGDHFAEELARELGLPILIYYPQIWNIDKNLAEINGKAAYAQVAYARNTKIADKANILIALVSSNREGGTEDTIKKFLTKNTREALILI